LIISASRRTDIPAFYSDWFMNRVREGSFCRVNPFNSRQVTGFSLKPEHVDAVCFWTKNPRQMMPHLDELDERGLNYYFQFTLNPYDTIFEPFVPPLQELIATFRELARRIGPKRVVWRYDPVILTSATPVDWHLEQANRIAAELDGSTCRLMCSFYDFYGRGEGRLHKALSGTGIDLEDITGSDHRDDLERLARGFRDVGGSNGLQIFSCSEEIDLASFGIAHGACIDGNLIRELFGGTPATAKDKHQRRACGCVESVDMGIYNTCPYRCSYCYANNNEAMIERNRFRHYPDSSVLIGRHDDGLEVRTALRRTKKCAGISGKKSA
jgi:hypothetical protein